MRLEKNSRRCKRNPNPGRPLGPCRDKLQCIFVIDFLEYLVWELEAIDSPESVPLAVVLEVFAAGFQSALIIWKKGASFDPKQLQRQTA